MKRRGFTIVELLITIAIIAVLMTIVTTATKAAIRSAREKRTEATRVLLEAAIENYRAADPEGRWPGVINDMAESEKSGKLSESEAQRVFRLIVQRSTGESGTVLQLIDPHGLFVAPDGVQDGKGSGLSFDEARQGTQRRQKLAVARMVFGYQNTNSGRFHRFNIVYRADADSVSVSTHCYECLTNTGGCRDENCPNCHRGR